jgi:penicillin amidase
MSGQKTASGKPLVANDMHLALTAPAVWFENHLVGGGIDATGVSLPGIPGIISGHNGYVSWAITNGFPDVQDLYIENIRREPDGRVMVEYMEGWYEADVICEDIKVKNGKTVVEEVIITRHGPVINSLSPEAAGEQPIAMRWTALDPGTMLQEILYPTLQAKSCKEFHESLRHWTLPVLNFVYADTAGNIGFTHAGKIPIRRKGEGRIPVPGWVDTYEWDGYIPFDSLPQVENPPEGFIVTANNRVVEKYSYHLGGEMMRGDRAQRITELLRCCDKLDVRYAMRMQYDRKSPQGEEIARVLGALPLEGRKRAQDLQPVVEMLKEWDAEMTPESPAAVIHQVTARTLVAILVAHKLGVSREKTGKPKKPGKPDMALHYAGMGINPVLSPVSYYMERSMEWLELVLGNPDSPWFDQGGGETREDIIYKALCESVDFLKAALGPNPRKWAWGKLHKLRFNHHLGTAALLRDFFSRGSYPVGGDGTTIWATHSSLYDLNSDFLVGPPYRMIVDLGNLRNSWSLLAPGQSGHPGSPHYDDQVKGWFEHGYHPMLYYREDIEREAEHRLLLIGRVDMEEN